MVEGSVRGGKTDGGRARLREAIRDGRFLAGTYLPSARDLARQLGISKSSVHNILKLLQEEGLIQIYPGCGALVLEIGWQQRQAVAALLAANGWADIECRKDFGGNDRCMIAHRPEK